MKNIGLFGLVIALVAVFGGYGVYQLTMPRVEEEELAPVDSETGPGNQFLQVKPNSLPPVAVGGEQGVEDDGNEVVQNNDLDKTGRVSGAEDVAGETDKVAREDMAADNEKDSVTSIDQPGVVISMTDLGFFPSSITVEKGTKVTFMNDGQALHWPAADPHPVHNSLPEFDAKEGIATGASYSFVFNQTGTWNFHDHLNPQYKGMIVVK